MGTEEDNTLVGEGRKCSAFGFIVAIQETVGFLFLIVHSLIEFGVEMIQRCFLAKKDSKDSTTPAYS